MIGNMLDPAVSADGMKGGLGVGGTSEPNIKAEGAEHIHQHGIGHSGNPSQSSYGAGQSYQSVGPNTGRGELGQTEQHRSGVDYVKDAAGVGSGSSASGSGLGAGYGVLSRRVK